MAFRSTASGFRYLKELANGLRGGKATYATSTPQKMKAYAPTADFGHAQDHAKPPKKFKGDFVPVYVAIGMIALSATPGLHTALQQLKNSPQVRVNKKRRETLPEVEEPERVLDEADKFMKQSFFRKVAHVLENDEDYAVHDSTRADIFAHKPRAETLKSAGVDPKFRVMDG